jgi:hypothetical protein
MKSGFSYKRQKKKKLEVKFPIKKIFKDEIQKNNNQITTKRIRIEFDIK